MVFFSNVREYQQLWPAQHFALAANGLKLDGETLPTNGEHEAPPETGPVSGQIAPSGEPSARPQLALSLPSVWTQPRPQSSIVTSRQSDH